MERSLHLLVAIFTAGCSQQAVEVHQESEDFITLDQSEVSLPEPRKVEQIQPVEIPANTDHRDTLADNRARWAKFPYVCEEFRVEARDDGKLRHRRIRQRWTKRDRLRFRDIVRTVAKEMGADPRLVQLWATRESTLKPFAIHVLNGDLDGAVRAWERHRYDEIRREELEAIMEKKSQRSREYWTAKAELSRILRFKDNPYYHDQVEYDLILPSGEKIKESKSRWAYGYGPFGFNPAYFLQTWDASAPPWIFCNEEGVIAVVTAIWAARKHQAECSASGYGDSYEVVNRRFSSGNCQPQRPEKDRGFRRRAKVLSIDPNQRARLGKKWPAATSDRDEVVSFMRKRLEEEGLLASQQLAKAG